MFQNLIWGPHLAEKSVLFKSFAASIGYYLILSIAPFLAVVFGVSDYFLHIDLTEPITQILQQVLPPEGNINIKGIVRAATSAGGGGLLTITFIIAIWTTNQFMHELVRALHFIFATETLLPKMSFRSIISSLSLIMVWGGVLAFFSVFMLLAPSIERFIESLALISRPALTLWSITRYFVGFVLMVIAVGTTYHIADGYKHPMKLRVQSSLLVAASWIGVVYGFTHILPTLWSASVIHGALGSLIAMLLWAYVSAWVLLLGACLIVRRSPISNQ